VRENKKTERATSSATRWPRSCLSPDVRATACHQLPAPPSASRCPRRRLPPAARAAVCHAFLGPPPGTYCPRRRLPRLPRRRAISSLVFPSRPVCMVVENCAHSPNSSHGDECEPPLPCLPMVSPVERVDLPVRSSDLSDPQDFLLGDEHRMEV
jgi:hypothetical protein